MDKTNTAVKVGQILEGGNSDDVTMARVIEVTDAGVRVRIDMDPFKTEDIEVDLISVPDDRYKGRFATADRHWDFVV